MTSAVDNTREFPFSAEHFRVITDRIFRSPGVFEGAVVDFIAPKGFAVFNLADSAIVCGGILIVLLSFKGLDPDGTVHKD